MSFDIQRSYTDGFRDPMLISPADSGTNVRAAARCLVVVTAGDLSVTYTNGTTLSFTDLTAGFILPSDGMQRVNLTGTNVTVADAL